MNPGKLSIIKRLYSIIRYNLKYTCYFSLIAFPLLLSSGAFAQGNLLITPRRIVFEGNKRSFDLNLANIGQDTAIYYISMVQIRMKEDGGFETITEPDPGQNFADKNLRFFPRSVKLAPRESQVVKVQLLRTNQLAPGEYRSHFYFRSEPDLKPLGESDAPEDSSAISIRLIPVFGITIPAIIRIGESTTKITLSDLGLNIGEDRTPTLSFRFNRSGNFSVYGDLTIDHVSPNGNITRVGIANGIAVYTPNTVRQFKLNLSNDTGVDYRSGKLKVVFSSSSDLKPEKLAETELLLN